MSIKTSIPATKHRECWLDNIRTVACLMVIVVHVTVLYKYIYGSVDTGYWIFTVLLDSASRMCVPLFFMVSGSIFLADKNVRAKNILKVFCALTFYSFLSMSYYVIFTEVSFKELLLSFYSQPKMYHLWFLFYLFTFYIIFSLIKIKEINSKVALIIIILLYTIFNYKLNDISMFFGGEVKNGFYIRADYFHLFLYTVAGAYLAKIEVNKTYFRFAMITLVSSIIAITLLTVEKSFQVGRFDAIFQSYTSVPVFFSAISAFYVVRCVNVNGRAAAFSELISSNSLAIYGIHAIILEFIRLKKIYLSDNPALNMLITYLVVLTISLLFAMFIKKYDKKGYVS